MNTEKKSTEQQQRVEELLSKGTIPYELFPIVISLLLHKVCDIEAMMQTLTRSTDNTQEDLITVKKASLLLGLAESTVRSKVSRRELPFHKPKNSKKLLFSRKELMEYLKSGRVKTSDEVYNDATIKIKRRLQ